MVTSARKVNLLEMFLFPLLTAVYSRREEFAPKETCFLKKQTLLKGLSAQVSRQEFTSCLPCKKWLRKKKKCVSIHLKHESPTNDYCGYNCFVSLTLKAPRKILGHTTFFFSYFSEKIMLDISYESFQRQFTCNALQNKCQTLFSLKNKKKQDITCPWWRSRSQVNIFCMSGKLLPQGTSMSNMRALSETVKKLWSWLIFSLK